MENPEKSCEPMDIDLSANSVHEMDISFNESVNDKYLVVKRTPIISSTPVSMAKIHNDKEFGDVRDVTPSVKFENIKKFHIKKNYKAIDRHVLTKRILSIIFVICLSTITYQIYDFKCSNLCFEYLRETLTKKVYGQTDAILAITEFLEASDQIKILLFTGSTGVGKTYTASLILENTGYLSNVYQYTMPSFVNTFSTEMMLGLTFCKSSLVVVDDLNIEDIEAKSHIENIVSKSKLLEMNVTLILIYNCGNTVGNSIKKCDDKFHTQLLNKYKNIEALIKLIQFKSLTDDCLIKCIENELGNGEMNERDRKRLLKNFNVSLDGCKGVHSKVKFLNIV